MEIEPPVVAVVVPAIVDTSPPESWSFCPTLNLIEPPRPVVAEPVDMVIEPELPD
jgi:hypothetical protein